MQWGQPTGLPGKYLNKIRQKLEIMGCSLDKGSALQLPPDFVNQVWDVATAILLLGVCGCFPDSTVAELRPFTEKVCCPLV